MQRKAERKVTSGNAINESIGGTPLSTRTYLIGTLAARNSTGQAMTSDIPSATSTSAPPSSHHPPDSMIALYVITGLISSMFLLIVLMGARRAARNPERYGRREGDDTQGPQSTAGGIAQAILDTFPVIKFNRSTSTTHERGFRGSQPKRLSSEGEPSSVVLPELNQVNHARQSLGVRSLEDDETFRTASEDFDESLKSGPTPSGSRRASGNHVAHRSMIDEVDADAAGDQCPICLLDFEEGDDLRLLPCEKEHVYHKACIDPWLLQVSGSCPLCRKGE